MANLSDLVCFTLTVTTRYKKAPSFEGRGGPFRWKNAPTIHFSWGR